MIEPAHAVDPAYVRQHLVRFGALGTVGRFTPAEAARYRRHDRVVVRTSRGLELGEVLAEPNAGTDGVASDGSILRRMSPQDELLAARLEKNRQGAMAACAARLAELDSAAALIDVEHLFDGRTLVFYFLGELSDELQAMTQELAEIYEAQAQFRQFATAVDAGCGPGCGTETAQGCKTCASGCALSASCESRAPGR